MALALNRENFFLHRLHSLTGIVPVGFYMVQHLTLNSFSLVSPERYDAVGDWFYSLPQGILWFLEIFVVLLPLIFHAVYGMFIAFRAKDNFVGTKYGWSQNRMFWLQRVTGIFLMVFLIYHILSTTGHVKLAGDHHVVGYIGMREKLSALGGMVAVFYVLGVLAASYHLAYGIWNFCVRWGITVSEAAQARIQKAAFGIFVGISVLGIAAILGFFVHKAEPKEKLSVEKPPITRTL